MLRIVQKSQYLRRTPVSTTRFWPKLKIFLHLRERWLQKFQIFVTKSIDFDDPIFKSWQKNVGKMTKIRYRIIWNTLKGWVLLFPILTLNSHNFCAICSILLIFYVPDRSGSEFFTFGTFCAIAADCSRLWDSNRPTRDNSQLKTSSKPGRVGRFWICQLFGDVFAALMGGTGGSCAMPLAWVGHEIW